MKALELKMSDEVYRRLATLAAHDQQAVDEFALGKLEGLVRAIEDFAELERRARRGSIENFKAAMAKVPPAPPLAGDELPQ
jgi:hypothetical protein